MNKVILNRISDTIKKAVVPALLIVSVCGCSLFQSGGSRSGKSPERIPGADIPACFSAEVMISTGTAYGGGTMLASPSEPETVYVVSAAHLIRSFGDASTVTDMDGRHLDCDLVWLDEDCDTGLLKSADRGRTAIPVLNPDIPAEIACFNAAHDGLVSGFITGTATRPEDPGSLLYLLISTEEGMSGSGLYDLNGSYCGMLAGSFDETRAAAVSAETILSVIGNYESTKEETKND